MKTSEHALPRLRKAVRDFVSGEMGFKAVHQLFHEIFFDLPDSALTKEEWDTWYEISELVYMGQDDPVEPADRAVGVIGEAELRDRIGRLIKNREW